MNNSLRATKRLQPGADKHLSGVFNSQVKDSFISVGDPYGGGQGEGYALARGKQMSARVPNAALSNTSYLAVGSKYGEKQKRDSRETGRQFGVGHNRSIDGALASTTYTAVGDPYGAAAHSAGSYGLAKGKQMIPGPKPSNLTVDGTIGGTKSYVSVGDPYLTKYESYGLAKGKQFLGGGNPKIATTVYDHAPLNQDAVFEQQYLRLFEKEGYHPATQVRVQSRLSETIAKTDRILNRDRGPEFTVAQGLPTLSYTRGFNEIRGKSLEEEEAAARFRAKFLKKAPKIAAQLDPSLQRRRPSSYVGPESGPQLLGRCPERSGSTEPDSRSQDGRSQEGRSQAPSFGRRSVSSMGGTTSLDDPSSTPWLRFAMSPAPLP
jgi:hypothetical protein